MLAVKNSMKRSCARAGGGDEGRGGVSGTKEDERIHRNLSRVE
jgi:hypothetical protein